MVSSARSLVCRAFTTRFSSSALSAYTLFRIVDRSVIFHKDAKV